MRASINKFGDPAPRTKKCLHIWLSGGLSQHEAHEAADVSDEEYVKQEPVEYPENDEVGRGCKREAEVEEPVDYPEEKEAELDCECEADIVNKVRRRSGRSRSRYNKRRACFSSNMFFLF